MDFPLDAMDAGVRDCRMLPLMGSHTCGMNNQHESWVDLRLGGRNLECLLMTISSIRLPSGPLLSSCQEVSLGPDFERESCNGTLCCQETESRGCWPIPERYSVHFAMSSNEEEQPTSSQLNVKFDVVPETLEPSYKEHFPVFVNGLVQGEPGGFVFHPHYAQNANKIYNMKVRSDDVWIRTFPRSGTTWTSELAWLIMNDCNFQEAARVPLTVRSPNIDTNYFANWGDFAPPEIMDNLITIEKIEEMTSPRVIKSHLPFQLLPPNLLDTAKVIYVARNPKDAIVSFFYFHKLVKLCYYAGEMDDFVDYFLSNKLLWTPYFPTVLEAWAKRDHPNLLFLFYEDMKKDLPSEIQKIAAFLNKTVTPEQIEKLVDHVDIDKFAKNESVNMTREIKAGLSNEGHTFIRKGETGGWKNHFSPEVNRKIDEWIEKNLEGSDLKFVTELD